MTLDKYEEDMELNIEKHASIAGEKDEMSMLVNAAKEHAKKRKSITLRIHEMDLEAMRIKASKAGVPYQTYINMLIHQDASQI